MQIVLILGEQILEKMGKKIKERRENTKYTQEVLAERINLSTDQYRNIENGRSIGSVSTILNICNVLEITPNDLFYEFLDKKDEILDKKLYNEFQELSSENKEIIKTLMLHMNKGVK